MLVRPSLAALLLGALSAAALAQGGREHVIPLFLPADAPETGAAGRQQGFLRVINRSAQAGVAQIVAHDDGGTRHGPVELALDAHATVHLNSDDLENGNTGKGLDGALGGGRGNWRLVLASETLDLEPLAYVRTRGDGLLIAMNGSAAEVDNGVHLVPVFNPASNPNQRSSLRIANLDDARAEVEIAGRDDDGQPGAAAVATTVPARGAIQLTAVDLEEMGLGDGAGKWSLTVTANRRVRVVSLMDTPSGHLANLSAARPEYRGATGLYRLYFDDDDRETGDGFLVLLPDSRLYAWLPESDGVNRIARGAYETEGRSLTASGVVYESGRLNVSATSLVGGAESVTFAAEVESGDWIRGDYAVADGARRRFSGAAFAGFERGGATAAIAGVWRPLGEDPDLPATLDVGADGVVDGVLAVDGGVYGDLECAFDATFAPVHPAYAVYRAAPAVDCGPIAVGGEENPEAVESVFAIMDPPRQPGDGGRALMLSILPGDDNEVGFGGLYGRDGP